MGYGSGMCSYDSKKGYTKGQCSNTKGNCDADVNECSSKPCKNGATCSESNSLKNFPLKAYRCSCKDGYADGLCNYKYISQFKTQCTVVDSSKATKSLRGNCNMDVDEYDQFELFQEV